MVILKLCFLTKSLFIVGIIACSTQVIGADLHWKASPSTITLDVLLARVQSPDWKIRFGAALELEIRGSKNIDLAERCLAGIESLSRDPDDNVRSMATLALGKIGATHIWLAQRCLVGIKVLSLDDDDNVRSMAAGALAEIGAAHEELAQQCIDEIKVLSRDRYANVRSSAALALGDIESARTLQSSPVISLREFARMQL